MLACKQQACSQETPVANCSVVEEMYTRGLSGAYNTYGSTFLKRSVHTVHRYGLHEPGVHVEGEIDE